MVRGRSARVELIWQKKFTDLWPVHGNTFLIRYSFLKIKATQLLLLDNFDTHKYRTLLPDLYLIDDYIVVDIMDVYVNKYINEYIYLNITMLLCTRLLLFSSI